MTNNKQHWVIKIVPALAFAAGIIMASIGGMITLASTAKLILFEHDSYSYVSREQCLYNYNDYLPVEDVFNSSYVKSKTSLDKNPRKRTEGEIEKCLVDKRLEEKQRFQETKKQDIVDGLASLIIGLILILGFRKRK